MIQSFNSAIVGNAHRAIVWLLRIHLGASQEMILPSVAVPFHTPRKASRRSKNARLFMSKSLCLRFVPWLQKCLHGWIKDGRLYAAGCSLECLFWDKLQKPEWAIPSGALALTTTKIYRSTSPTLWRWLSWGKPRHFCCYGGAEPLWCLTWSASNIWNGICSGGSSQTINYLPSGIRL